MSLLSSTAHLAIRRWRVNELIEELWNRELEYNSVPMDFIEFKQAIQTACKAQRNACLRAYGENYAYVGVSEVILFRISYK